MKFKRLFWLLFFIVNVLICGIINQINKSGFAEVKEMKQTKNILSWLIIALNIVGVV